MSRRICVDLYNALIKLRPEWEAETLKIVMTGSAEDGPSGKSTSATRSSGGIWRTS